MSHYEPFMSHIVQPLVFHLFELGKRHFFLNSSEYLAVLELTSVHAHAELPAQPLIRLSLQLILDLPHHQSFFVVEKLLSHRVGLEHTHHLCYVILDAIVVACETYLQVIC